MTNRDPRQCPTRPSCAIRHSPLVLVRQRDFRGTAPAARCAGCGVKRRGGSMSTTGPFEDVADGLPTPLALTPQDVTGIGEELAAYHAHFAPLFQRREQRAWARVYLQGLLTAEVPRKNVEAMALRLLGAGPGADRRVRALQQFIGEGAWDDDGLLAAHRRLVNETLGEDDAVLIIDGSDIPKR